MSSAFTFFSFQQQSFALNYKQKAVEQGIQEICITDNMPLLGNHAAERISAGKVK